jgi:phosphoribosylglycinamide formyltransferase-1
MSPLPTSPLGRPARLAVLISGGGTTLMNFVEQIREGTLPAEIVLVIATRSDCGGIVRAASAGLRCDIVPRRKFESVTAFSRDVFDRCREVRADLIEIPDDFRLRVMNIHPALIPAFCGKGFYGHHVHEAVLKQGAKVSGCTVHFVDNEYDRGPIITQRCVPVRDDDTADTLAERVFAEECRAYPDAIRWFAEGRLRIEGHRVRVLDEAVP